jgi:hypothetical protein
MSIGDSPTKGSDKYAKVIVSTDTKPIGAFIGQLIIESDTGLVYEWSGAGWCPRRDGIEIDPLVKSMPTTSTFHHLGHEGNVFIHSERHNGLASEATIDMLLRVPAGDATRQIHFRFNAKAKANTLTLDVDVLLYSGVTASADGTPDTQIASTNDAIVKTSGLLLFTGPTITDLGEYKGQGAMLGENKATGTQDMAVPEFVMAPDGASARDYLIRTTNNGGGTADILHNLFWYDTGAA